MIDREKVIKGLEVIKQFFGYGLPSTAEMFDSYYGTLNDAIALLKEQEAVEPTVSGAEEHDGLCSWWYQCGKCKMPIDYGDRFCRRCGQEVKWNA